MNGPLDQLQLFEMRLASLGAKVSRWQILDQREEWEDNFSAFVQSAWPYIDNVPFQSCWALDALCDHLEAVTFGQIRFLLINQPPRTGKTKITSVCWNAWTWARRHRLFTSGAQVKFLCGSYNERLSLDAANMSRRLILSPWYQTYWGDRFMLRVDQNAKSDFGNTENGARVSTSVSGTLLGLGGDIISIDDPHNTETEKKVESDADRRKVASWWQEISSTRMNDPKRTAIVVNMQRLHQKDLSGIILDSSDDVVHLMLPMHFDERRRCVTVVLPQYDDPNPWQDPRETDGELLWPERFGPKEVENLETRLGPYMASGRLEQSPTPKGGAIIKADWWRLWDMQEARRYGLEWGTNRKEFPPMELVVGSLDTSYGEKEENDFNALTIWGLWLDRNKNRRAMLMYGFEKRLPLHGEDIQARPGEPKVNLRQRQEAAWGLTEYVADACRRYKVKRLLIENKNRGPDVAKELRRLFHRENWGIEMVEPVGDKVARTHAIVPLFTDGSVWAPNTRWASNVIDQSALFPKAEHDDSHDTVTQFLKWARDNGLLLRAEEMNAALEEEATFRHRESSVAERYGVGR